MDAIFEHKCYKCGLTAELDFVFAGPHVKAICSCCGFYVKFFDKTKIPDIRETKMRIMTLAMGDLTLIEQLKNDMGIFYPGISGLEAKLAYWKLYLKLL